MRCKAVLIEIEELEATARPSVEANAHLLACASCRAFADERAKLRGLIAELEGVSAPPDFDWRLRARLAAAKSEGRESRFMRWSFTPGVQAITLAACFALLVIGLVLYQQIKPLPASATGSAVIAAGGIKESASVEPGAQASPTVNSQDSQKEKPSISVSERSGARAARSIKANGTRPEYTAMATQGRGQRIFSNDFGSRGAQDLSATGIPAASMNGVPVISVRVPSNRSAQLRFEDEQGTRRTLSPINFGGQESIERPEKARLVPVSEKGIW